MTDNTSNTTTGEVDENPDRAVARAIEEHTRGLVARRDALLDETKKLKERLAAYDGVDPQEYHQLKKAADKLQTQQAEVEGDWLRLRERLEQRHSEELSKANQALEEERSFTRAPADRPGSDPGVVEAGRGATLDRRGQGPSGRQGRCGCRRAGTRKAVIKTDIGTLDLDTFVSEWVQTPEGKAYVGAPRSAGGGAHESGGRHGERRLRRRDLASDAEKARFIRENGRDAYLALDP